MNEFADFIADTTVDRSTLELYAKCPLSARLKEKHIKSAGMAAAVGQECHNAISRTIADYIGAFTGGGHWMGPPEITETLRTYLLRSRPDTQPEVLKAIWSPWSVAEILHSLQPWAILRHDGGDGELSGQMAEHVETSLGLVTVTSEIDLLGATTVPEIVRAVDWKTGWADWAEGDVESSFQMQLLAWLVFANYPDVQEVHSQVCNTRTRRMTYPVRFLRSDMDKFAARIAEACETWMQYRACQISAVPAWPTREGCQLCDAAAFCTAGDDDVLDAHRSPETWLKILHATECKADSIRKTLAEIVHKEQRDITAGGLAFGLNKPKADRRPQCSLYEVR